jgi:6-pyruvoyltetrahydropterin/6-carboxytetrahydropterin synthase
MTATLSRATRKRRSRHDADITIKRGRMASPFSFPSGVAVMPRITRRMEFDAGHRILGHESKCAHLHGHRYVVHLTVETPTLDNLGRVVDFSVIKTIVGGWLDEHWDHNMLLNSDDPLLKTIQVCNGYAQRTQANAPVPTVKEVKQRSIADTLYGKQVFGTKSPFIFVAENPTAEVMASFLVGLAHELFIEKQLGHIRVRKVRLYETPNCWADAFLDLPR